MERWKRLFYYLLINVVVSALTVLLVLNVWERANDSPVEVPAPVVIIVTATTAPIAEGVPLPAGTPVASPQNDQLTSYQVQSGDTLSGIAADFDVTLEAILAANDLQNPDSLDVGDVILIPVAPDPTEALTPTGTIPPPATPPPLTPGPTSPPLLPGQAAQVEILTVVGAGVLADERVIIKYNGDGEISLQGWRLEDADGQTYVFPQLTLFKDGAVTIFTTAGTDTVVELYWGLDETVWAVGEEVALIDPSGEVQATYRVP